MEDNIVRTDRLVMRRAKVRDLGPLHAVLSHPEAMRYWSTPPHGSLHQSREWLKAMMASPETESDDFVVEHEGQVIGKAGFWRLPEIGYIFHPDSWGRASASNASPPLSTAPFSASRSTRCAPTSIHAMQRRCGCFRSWASSKPAATGRRSLLATNDATASISSCSAAPGAGGEHLSRMGRSILSRPKLDALLLFSDTDDRADVAELVDARDLKSLDP